MSRGVAPIGVHDFAHGSDKCAIVVRVTSPSASTCLFQVVLLSQLVAGSLVLRSRQCLLIYLLLLRVARSGLFSVARWGCTRPGTSFWDLIRFDRLGEDTIVVGCGTCGLCPLLTGWQFPLVFSASAVHGGLAGHSL